VKDNFGFLSFKDLSLPLVVLRSESRSRIARPTRFIVLTPLSRVLRAMLRDSRSSRLWGLATVNTDSVIDVEDRNMWIMLFDTIGEGL
jgi:hypothetical protein